VSVTNLGASPSPPPVEEPERLDGPTGPSGHAGPERDRFDDLYRREMPRLVALARALAGPSRADDLAQEAMLSAYRRWSEVTIHANPEAWVRRVCANLATSLLRRKAAEARALLLLSSRPSPVALAPAHDAVWDEVRRLPRRQAPATAGQRGSHGDRSYQGRRHVADAV